MLETMEEVPNKFLTIAVGKAVSCGAILLSNGDIRFAGNFSRIMIHNISSISYGDVTTIQADANEINRLNQVFLGLLAKNCGITYSELLAKIKASTDSKDLWLSPEAALKFGIIDHIGMPELIPHVQWGCSVALPKQETLNKKSKSKKTR
jgi:ATP-dependent Clp protease protease subunit